MDDVFEIETLEDEIWRKLDYLPPHLEVSSKGRVRKFKNAKDWVLLCQRDAKNVIQVHCENNYYAVHRLVADAFVGNPNPDQYTIVRHKDGDYTNNEASNLEWTSHKNNLIRNYSKGSDTRKKIYCEDMDIVFGSLRSATYMLGVHPDLLTDAIRNQWCLFGHTFRYLNQHDPILHDHDICYISCEDALEIAKKCKSREEFIIEVVETIESNKNQ